jgi:hypothetical protein
VLVEAVDASRRAVAATAEDSPELARRLNGLGAQLVRLYRHNGEARVLAEAREVAARAAALGGATEPARESA